MKKLSLIIIVLLVITGCSPYHNTEVTVELNPTLGGELTLVGSVDGTVAKGVPLKSVQSKITTLFETLDRYQGTLESTIEGPILQFRYTETFETLDEFETIVLRLFKEEIHIEEEIQDDIFKREIIISGLDFSANTVMNDIYDAIEEQKIFGFNSKKIREHHQEIAKPVIIFNDVQYHDGEVIRVIEHKSLESHEILIQVNSDDYLSLINRFHLGDKMDQAMFVEYFKTKFNEIEATEYTLEVVQDENKQTVDLIVRKIKHEDLNDFLFAFIGQPLRYSFTNSYKDTRKLSFDPIVYENPLQLNVDDIKFKIDLSKYQIVSYVDVENGNQIPYDADTSPFEQEGKVFDINIEKPFIVYVKKPKMSNQAFVIVGLLIAGIGIAKVLYDKYSETKSGVDA